MTDDEEENRALISYPSQGNQLAQVVFFEGQEKSEKNHFGAKDYSFSYQK